MSPLTQHTTRVPKAASTKIPRRMNARRSSTPLLVQRAIHAPATLTAQDVLRLQRALGNQRVSNLLQSPDQTADTSSEATGTQPLIQRKSIETMGGEWEDLRYTGYKKNHTTNTEVRNDGAFTLLEEEKGNIITQGADMKLEFTPNASVDAEKVGLTQTIRSLKEGDQHFPLLDEQDDFPIHKHGYKARTLDDNLGKGTAIDRQYPEDNPIYGAQSGAGNLADTDFGDQDEDKGIGGDKVGGIFNRYGRRTGTDAPVSAVLSDTPQRTAPLPNNAIVEFETTALALKGAQANTYYGSVRWGYQTDGAGKPSLLPFEKVSEGTPTPTFLRAASAWNQASAKYGQSMINKTFVAQQPTVDLPLVNANSQLALPSPAHFNNMKDRATNQSTPLSGGLSRKKYQQGYTSFNTYVQNEEWAKAKKVIKQMRKKLDTMNSKGLKYWSSFKRKEEYFTPLYNAVKAQERAVVSKLG